MTTDPRPRAPHPWAVLAVLTLVNALAQSGGTVLAAVLPLIKSEFGYSDSQLGLLSGYGSAVSFALLALPISHWAMRHGSSLVLSLSMLVCALANLATGVCSAFWQLISARLLAGRGVRVVAVEPNEPMALAADPHPLVRWTLATAEETGLPASSVDLVLCAQAFHWFATRAALDEFARVLKPGGRLGLVWNVRDESVDWVAELTRIVTPHEGDAPRFHKGSWRQAFPHPAFGPLQESVFAYTHEGPPQQVIVDRFMSVSFIAALPEHEQARVRAQIEDLIASHPALRGRQMLQFPYHTRAFVCVRH